MAIDKCPLCGKNLMYGDDDYNSEYCEDYKNCPYFENDVMTWEDIKEINGL